jgi:hypothetical protein
MFLLKRRSGTLYSSQMSRQQQTITFLDRFDSCFQIGPSHGALNSTDRIEIFDFPTIKCKLAYRFVPIEDIGTPFGFESVDSHSNGCKAAPAGPSITRPRHEAVLQKIGN